jgi:hypothetical protein
MTEPDRIEPIHDLAEQMRHPLFGRSPADIEDPFTEDRGLDQRVAPKRICDLRVLGEQLAQMNVRDMRDAARPERCDVVVEDVEMQALQVGNVAGHVKRQDLPSAHMGRLGATHETVEQQKALVRSIALDHDGGMRRHRFEVQRQPLDRREIVLGQRPAHPQLAYESVEGTQDLLAHHPLLLERYGRRCGVPLLHLPVARGARNTEVPRAAGSRSLAAHSDVAGVG